MSTAAEQIPAGITPPKKKIRSKTPTVLQMEAVECGAACLGIILEYFGKIVPLEELRVECGVSRDGSKASNVVRAARRYGMVAGGYRYDLKKMMDIPVPVVLFWEFNHFLVLEGFGPDRVYLNDPTVGPRSVTYKEFDESYTGVVMTFSPGPEFEVSGKRPSLFSGLLRRAEGSHTALLYTFLAGVALVVPGLLFPVFAGVFVDKVLIAQLDNWFRPILFVMVLTAIVQLGLTAIQKYFLLRFEIKLAVTASSRFLWHTLRLPAEFYAQRYGGEISTRVRLNDEVARLVGNRLVTTAIDAILIIAYAALMLTYDVWLTLVGVAAVAVNVVVARSVNRAREDGNRRLLQEAGKASGALIGGLASIETLKASSNERDLFGRWAGFHAKYVNAQQELGILTQIFLAIPTALTALAGAAILGLGAVRVMQGAMSMGQLVAFQTLMTGFLTPVENMVRLASEIQEMKGKVDRLDDVLRYEPATNTSLDDLPPEATVEDNGTDPAPRVGDDRSQQTDAAAKKTQAWKSGNGAASRHAVGRLTGHVEFRDVTFGYSRFGAPILKELHFTVEPGQRVALVGSSGCGKSTVAKLATGLYRPWSGQILFDGVPRDEIPPAVLRNSIGFVDQDIIQFEGTVQDNLTLWDSTISDRAVVKAARDAAIHDDIAARAGGYNGLLEEGGANLSGGQRQRLEIARALVTDPRVLILDEATSALDAVTEQAIDQSLRLRGCACIIIAHRLSTIRDADEIIVLNQGDVVQRGTHPELMERPDGSYARLAREG